MPAFNSQNAFFSDCFVDSDCEASRICVDYHCAKGNFFNILDLNFFHLFCIRVHVLKQFDRVTECLWGDFICRSNNKCVPKIARCDGVMDCDDKSDELNCSKKMLII